MSPTVATVPSNIIQRIQSLLALAKSDNLNEASSAAAQAEAMIAKYRLSMADVVSAGGQSAESIGEGEPLMRGARFSKWQNRLGVALSKRYGCLVINDGVEHTFRLIGLPSDVEIVRYMFAWIGAEIVRLARDERGMRARNSFCLGAVFAIGAALEAAKKAAEATHAGTSGGSAAIVLASRESEARAWLLKLLPGNVRLKRGGHAPSEIDVQAHERGIMGGGSLHLGQSLPGGPRALPAAPSRS